MNNFWITALGFLAAVTTTSSFVPQVVKTLKSQKTDDFSWGYLWLFSTGALLWLTYGILRQDIAVIVVNSVVLMLTAVIIGVKARTPRTAS